LVCLGYSLFGLATNSISIWGATYLNRIYNLDIPTVGYWLGILTLAAGIPATLFGGVIADWFRQKTSGGRMLFGAGLCFVSLVLWFSVLFSDNFLVLIPAGFLLLFAALAWIGAAAADVTEIAGANLRGLAVAILFFAINMAAYLIGSNIIGKLNDLAGIVVNPLTRTVENAEMMRYTMLVCPLACLFGGILLLIGTRSRSA
jgi:MFS family permease